MSHIPRLKFVRLPSSRTQTGTDECCLDPLFSLITHLHEFEFFPWLGIAVLILCGWAIVKKYQVNMVLLLGGLILNLLALLGRRRDLSEEILSHRHRWL